MAFVDVRWNLFKSAMADNKQLKKRPFHLSHFSSHSLYQTRTGLSESLNEIISSVECLVKTLEDKDSFVMHFLFGGPVDKLSWWKDGRDTCSWLIYGLVLTDTCFRRQMHCLPVIGSFPHDTCHIQVARPGGQAWGILIEHRWKALSPLFHLCWQILAMMGMILPEGLRVQNVTQA